MIQRANSLRYCLQACRRENIESREEALELGGFKPEVIDIEAHYVQRAMQLIDASDSDEHGEDEVVAIVDIGATMTTLSVLTELTCHIPASRCSAAGS